MFTRIGIASLTLEFAHCKNLIFILLISLSLQIITVPEQGRSQGARPPRDGIW